MTREEDLDEHDRLLLQLVRIAAQIRLTLRNLGDEKWMNEHCGLGYTIDRDSTWHRIDGAEHNDRDGTAYFAVGYLEARLRTTLDALDELLPPKDELDALVPKGES